MIQLSVYQGARERSSAAYLYAPRVLDFDNMVATSSENIEDVIDRYRDEHDWERDKDHIQNTSMIRRHYSVGDTDCVQSPPSEL